MTMKIIIVGATGTLGSAITKELKQKGEKHELICVGKTRGDLNCDIESPDSVRALYQEVGSFDALIATAGAVHFAEFAEMTKEDFELGLRSKLMGQVNLVQQGLDYINSEGSFTLTSGILADRPIPLGVSASMVNGALNSFAMAAAVQMPKNVRINVVSPGLVEDSVEAYSEFFPGHQAISMQQMTDGYLQSLEGEMTGETIRIY